MQRLKTLFTDHPASVDESYLQHLAFAMRFSAMLMLAAGAALVHAVFPFLCSKTASRIVARLYDRTHDRGVASATRIAAE
ncbi:MAG: hypothetical protein KJN93_09050 [Alphaproteobacteria bacterium]|nr:hypothetical protein [Alphaproteobacteria bacterium]NNF25046.1 hypothetical protein [Paracoccaceae bacterium]